MQGGGNGRPGGSERGGSLGSDWAAYKDGGFWRANRMKSGADTGPFNFNRFGWGRDGQTAQGMGAGDKAPAQGPIVHDSGAPDVPGPIETGPGNVVQPGPNIGPGDYDQPDNEKKQRWLTALQGGGRHRWKGY